MNEPETLTVKQTRDESVLKSSEDAFFKENEMKTIYHAALALRKCINKSEKWLFRGSFDDVNDKHLPKELYYFFKWLIKGPKDFSSTGNKFTEVHKRIISLMQNTISMTLTERQARNAQSKALSFAKEMPQQFATGLAIHQSTRSKEIINFLHGFGLSVEYNKLLREEAHIEKHVIQRMQQNGGVYIPPDTVIGRRVFFAINNVDFSEDTPHGKGTLHGTAMAIYQRKNPEDTAPILRLDDSSRNQRSMKNLPATSLLSSPKPPPNPKSNTYPSFLLHCGEDLLVTAKLKSISWLLARSLTRISLGQERQTESIEESGDTENGPLNSTPYQFGLDTILLSMKPCLPQEFVLHPS